jgi:hypothetical protein
MEIVPQLDALLRVLREHQGELRASGVQHAAISGSVDLVSRGGLKPGRHDRIAAEAVAAF